MKNHVLAGLMELAATDLGKLRRLTTPEEGSHAEYLMDRIAASLESCWQLQQLTAHDLCVEGLRVSEALALVDASVLEFRRMMGVPGDA